MIDDDLIYVHIGALIKKFREDATPRETQESLAEKIGVSRASLANYESGNQAIYISDLYKIADKLDVEIHQFIPTLHVVRSKSRPRDILLHDDNLTAYQKKELNKLIDDAS